MKEYQAEELSRCIDELNDGNKPITNDQELQEMLKLVNAIKESAPVNPPQEIIDNIVNTMSSELAAQKQQKRNKWLYGSIGSAAAVLVLALVQLMQPTMPNTNIAQLQSDNQSIIQQIDKVNENQPSNLPQIVASIAAETADKVKKEVNTKTEQPVENEKNIAMQTESNAKVETTSLAAEPDHKIAIMSLPGLTAQSVSIDNVLGIVRQVYNQGDDEIIITQKVIPNETVKTASVGVAAMQAGINPQAKAKVEFKAMSVSDQAVNNKIVVKKNNYEVTIEGKKTKEELMKLADSLEQK